MSTAFHADSSKTGVHFEFTPTENVFHQIEPLHDRILVQRLPEPSGLIIIDRDLAVKARVIAVGQGKRGEPMWVYPGQIVCFSGNIDKYDWNDVLKCGEYLVIQQNDLLGIVDEDTRVEAVTKEHDYER